MATEHIELSIEHALKIIATGKKAMKLAENSDFRELVLEGYFEKEASRLVRFYADGSLDAETRGHIERDMHGIGAFQRFMQRLVKLGEQAESDLENARERLAEARMEELFEKQQAEDPDLFTRAAEYGTTLGA